ncbi:MAG: peptide chain release factor N(5)-glutamine methyltransferase [Planctomycetia bacterium]|nr:peptide chain release factor N(5)-glutamine methyltransferase [Planctomycetia bacterium]MCC7315174.1 peptide chain release factor N(5)-glutamine methyltransferase [Planctomycetota bacterium]
MSDTPVQASESWTIGRLLAWTRSHFESRGVDDARLCAELLLAKALGCKRIELYARFEEVPDEARRATFRELVRAAAEHQPIAYLIGTREFYSLEFEVTPDVLIPRPETELLVERALDWIKGHPADRHELLDIGAGSGCLAVTICKRAGSVHAVAGDISEPALAVVQRNAARHGVAERVKCVRADMLDLPPEALPPSGFDVIVSNPPYIAETDRDSLPENVRKYEPSVALFAGDDGLSAYRKIAAKARSVLRPGGVLILEVGSGQADSVEKMMVADGGLAAAGRFRDLGGIERAIELTLPA